MTIDTVHAFCEHGHVERQTRSAGPLADLTFGLKDLFDVAGVPTGAGNPDWLATHPAPERSATVVELLLAAGARLIGKTHTDELAWSLNGENTYYGTPRNVAAPGRIPGGSSSGSAAATAAGLVDFAIGTDTGGSVRLPASYCGVYGMRPTYGRIPIGGVVPLAPSYDTVGWFAHNPAILARIGNVLLGEAKSTTPARRLLIARDLLERAGPDVTQALRPALSRLSDRFDVVEDVEVAQRDIAAWRNAFRLIQSSEVWNCHGEWVQRVRPQFGPGIRERFEAASRLDPSEVENARVLRQSIAARMHALLPEGTVLAMPTAPGPAPFLATPEPELNDFRAKALELLCPAGHAGLPQISLPLAHIEDCPIGLSILAGQDHDETLLTLASEL